MIALVFPVQRSGIGSCISRCFSRPLPASFLLMGAMSFLIGTCAIPLNSILSLIRAKYWLIELLSGVLIPIAFFPKPLQILSAWLPFEHIAYTPLQIYLGKLDPARAAARGRNQLGLGGAAAAGPVTYGGIARSGKSPFREASCARKSRNRIAAPRWALLASTSRSI